MLQLKARLYCKEKKRLLPVKSIYLDLDIAYAGEVDDLSRYHLNQVDLMYWTRHTDINGNDIYEKDYIISESFKEPILIESLLHYGHLLYTLKPQKIQVVGNIFSDPKIKEKFASN